MPTVEDRIKDALAEHPGTLGPSELAEIVGTTVGTVNQVLQRLITSGDVERPSHGRYALAKGEPEGVGVGTGPALRWPGASEQKASRLPPALLVVCDGDGREIVRVSLSTLQTGEPLRVYASTTNGGPG